MKTGFYPKLAWDSIRKNKRLYVPYVLTGSLMVMMYYILNFLLESPAIEAMKGGSVLRTVLPLGCWVMAIFSLLFLFYTNSFLVKQRYREFGLYNILGMDKHNISRLILWENGFTTAVSVVTGLVCGIALSKGAELVLLNLLHLEVDFNLRISPASLLQTICIYVGIYVLLLMHSLIKVRCSKPLELMQSSKAGEKIPKFTAVFAVIGIGLLAGAYYLAVSIQEPTAALFLFFVAVVMVIIGTYFLFVSGSITFCQLLQKNKKYYYKPNHFVSVSSMVYRMKRNGAGLAGICILITMVLVMLSSTTTLYFGEEDAIRNRYPNGININMSYTEIDGIQEENLKFIRKKLSAYAPEGTDLSGTGYAVSAGQFNDEGIILDYTKVDTVNYDKVGCLYVISLKDYNNMMHEDKKLADDECFIYSKRLTTEWKTFAAEYGSRYKVKERLTDFREDGDALAMTMPSVYLVVNDVYTFAEPFFGVKNEASYLLMEYQWLCGFDCESVKEEKAAREAIENEVFQEESEKHLQGMFTVTSRESERVSFFELYGSLFFLGIMLSVVFLMAAVLMIYYKQISEGYEDQNRFEIMQKVGMTKRDIRKSINSQMLTVFFLPLIVAGIHLVFAFPFISKILLMFAFDDTILNVSVTFVCFVIFGVFYAIVYKITSGSYYTIVSGKKKR